MRALILPLLAVAAAGVLVACQPAVPGSQPQPAAPGAASPVTGAPGVPVTPVPPAGGTPTAGAPAGSAATPVAAVPGPAARPRPATPAGPPPPATLEVVARGFQQPLYVTHAGDGTGDLFVVERAGRIQVLRDGQIAGTLLDIRDQVLSRNLEQGLLGLAFDPDFVRNGRFYVNYTEAAGNAAGGQTVVARFTTDEGRRSAAASSEERLMTWAQPFANHNGGHVTFGPDGMLYIGVGDGGAANDPQNHGQRLDTVLGTLLRIDVSTPSGYRVPEDNPFVSQAGVRPEIWAYGLRNPWRFSFDAATGDLYIADVGQNRAEEIHFAEWPVPGGLNYGWKIMEGLRCLDGSLNCDRAGLELPVVEYGRGDGCSVTGGYVYRGERHPSMVGTYYYTDYCSGIVWGLKRDEAGQWQTTVVVPRGTQGLSSFGEGPDGELYLTNLSNGQILLLRPR